MEEAPQESCESSLIGTIGCLQTSKKILFRQFITDKNMKIIQQDSNQPKLSEPSIVHVNGHALIYRH